jgi:hypothetical protein
VRSPLRRGRTFAVTHTAIPQKKTSKDAGCIPEHLAYRRQIRSSRPKALGGNASTVSHDGSTRGFSFLLRVALLPRRRRGEVEVEYPLRPPDEAAGVPLSWQLSH